jgi:hypothetical protein
VHQDALEGRLRQHVEPFARRLVLFLLDDPQQGHPQQRLERAAELAGAAGQRQRSRFDLDDQRRCARL